MKEFGYDPELPKVYAFEVLVSLLISQSSRGMYLDAESNKSQVTCDNDLLLDLNALRMLLTLPLVFFIFIFCYSQGSWWYNIRRHQAES